MKYRDQKTETVREAKRLAEQQKTLNQALKPADKLKLTANATAFIEEVFPLKDGKRSNLLADEACPTVADLKRANVHMKGAKPACVSGKYVQLPAQVCEGLGVKFVS